MLNQEHSQFPSGDLPVGLLRGPSWGGGVCAWTAGAARRAQSLDAPSGERAGVRSVGPPHRLLQARGWHVGGRVAVAALGLHHVALAGQAGVEQRGARGRVGAGRQDARGRSLAAHHGELVGAGGRAVVQVVGGRAGLEGPGLGLRGAWVGRRQVGVVARGRAHGRHADADARRDGRRVGEGARVVHARVGDGGQRGELARVTEGCQVRGGCGWVEEMSVSLWS